MKAKNSRLKMFLTIIVVGSIMGCSNFPEVPQETTLPKTSSTQEKVLTKSTGENVEYFCTICMQPLEYCECSRCPKCGNTPDFCACLICSNCGQMGGTCDCHNICPNCQKAKGTCTCPTTSEPSQPTPSIRCECHSARCSGNPETCTCKEADYCKDNEECICRGHLGTTAPTDPTPPPASTTT